MKLALIVVALVAFALSAWGQFYAPQTDFHDMSQRRFPVEAARMVGWVRKVNDGAPVAEVSYRLETTKAGEIIWDLEWRDGASAVLRRAKVRYPEAALTTGAQWYRDVWKQIAGEWSKTKGSESEIAAAFWQGAEGAGLSRMEGVAAALKQVESGVPRTAADSSRLAGTLAQAAVPMVGLTVTLDTTMLARSAAWLCAAEQQGGVNLSTEWAPVLALSGREALAQAAWKAGKKSGPFTGNAQMWDLLIRMPPSFEALTTIAGPENRMYAAAVFQAYGDIDLEYNSLFFRMGQKLYVRDNWKRLHDYGPGLHNPRDNRAPIAPDFPSRTFRAWLAVLRTLPPALDDAGVREKAVLAKDYDGDRRDLAGPSAELAQLLNEGCQIEGPLTPVAVVTARDLLGFGWEFGGLQLGTLHNELRILANGRDSGLSIEKEWFGVIEGWNAFTQNLRLPPFKPLADTGRYESVITTHIAELLIQKPPMGWGAQNDGASTFFRRRWLADPHRALQYFIDANGKASDAVALIRRAESEGSQRSLAGLLTNNDYFNRYLKGNEWTFDEKVDELNLREELAKAVPLSIVGRLAFIESKYAPGRDPLGYAQALERLHWEDGVAFDPEGVFLWYVRANATESAKRFYDRWHGAMTNEYRFENGLGAANLALALLENDSDRIEKAMADCGSTTMRLPEITDAFLRNDLEAALAYIDDWLKTWSKKLVPDAYMKLREFVALVPALNDAAHADHKRALESFPRNDDFLFLQWVLANKAHLSPEEAAVFFGGEDTDPIITMALRKDRAGFERFYEPVASIQRARRIDAAKTILYAVLRNQLLPVAPPKEQPDLRPANAEPVLPKLRAIVEEQDK